MASTNRVYSINNLEIYAPYICSYSVFIFIAWCAYWGMQSNIQNECTTIELCPKYALGPAAPLHVELSQAVAFCFGLSLIAQLLQLAYSAKSHMERIPSYCSVCVAGLAACTHVAIAYDLLPVLISPFGRVVHVARFGEWIAVVPLITAMIHSLDIRDEADTKTLFFSSAIQQATVLFGGIGSVITHYKVAVFCIVASTICYSLIFCDMAKAAERLKEYRLLEAKEDNDIVKKLNKEGIIKSFYLTLICCVCWTYITIVYFCSISGVITHNTEFKLQNIGDVVIKLFYVYILSVGQVSVIVEEHLLNTINDVSNFFSRMKYITGRG